MVRGHLRSQNGVASLLHLLGELDARELGRCALELVQHARDVRGRRHAIGGGSLGIGAGRMGHAAGHLLGGGCERRPRALIAPLLEVGQGRVGCRNSVLGGGDGRLGGGHGRACSCLRRLSCLFGLVA